MPPYALQMLRHRSTAVWALLMLSTVVSWWLGSDHDVIGGREAATTGVLVIAFVKVWLVTTDFMEVRDAPRVLQVAVYGWTAGVCALLVGLYLAL